MASPPSHPPARPPQPQYAVRRAFLAAHAVVGGLALALAGLAAWRLTDVTAETRALREQTLPAARLAEDAPERFRLAQALARKADVSGDPRYVDRAWEEVHDLGADLVRLAEREPALAPAAGAAVVAVREATGAEGAGVEAAEGALETLRGEAGALLALRLEEAEGAGRSAARGLVAAAAALSVLLAYTSFRLARRVTAPLRDLVEATRAYASGDLGFRTPIRRDDEFGRVAGSMNEMAERLAAAREGEASLFLAVSHDLKTPLAAILEAGHLLAEGVPGPLGEGQRTLVEIVQKEAARLQNLVDLLLEARRLAADGAPDVEDVDMGELAAAAARPLDLLAKGRDVRIRLAVGTEFGSVRLDRARFEQVLVNLLDNAVRHSPRGGSVELGARRDPGGGVTIWVEDEGAGVAPEEAERLFEPFGRAGRRGGGTGLGLSICRRVVEAHGGAIGLAPGTRRGARFEVRLPAGGEAVIGPGPAATRKTTA